MKKLGLTPDEMDTILNKQSGVNAISGVSSDDRDICAAQNAGNKRASLAHEMQAYEIAKFIGSYIAAMNGVDGIVFTGGIGENGHWLRSRICSYLGYMGVQIDEKLNQATVKGAEAELTDPSACVYPGYRRGAGDRAGDPKGCRKPAKISACKFCFYIQYYQQRRSEYAGN